MEWFAFVDQPAEELAKYKKKGSLGEGIKTYALFGALVGLALAIGLLVGIGFLPQSGPFAGFGIASVVILPILFALISVVVSLIATGLTWIAAKIFGGDATFGNHYYLTSRMVWPIFGVGALLQALSLVMGVVILPFTIIWTIYSVDINTEVVKAAHGLTTFRAYLSWVVPILVLTVILFIVFAGLLFASGFVPPINSGI